MECLNCGHNYRANGTDIWQRKCPKCQSRHFVASSLLNTRDLDEKFLAGLSTGWNTVCLCPNCAAELKYGAVSLYNFEEKVKSVNEDIQELWEYKIQMQGEDRSIKYTPKHILAMKEALDFFDSNNEENEEIDDSKTLGEKEEITDIKSINNANWPYEILGIKKGDKCPICGVSNANKKIMQIYDRLGKTTIIEGRICDCGVRYLTRREYNEVIEVVVVKDVDGVEIVSSCLPKKKGKKGKISSMIIEQTAPKTVSKKHVKICPRCGGEGIFANKGMCWICYKEEIRKNYE